MLKVIFYNPALTSTLLAWFLAQVTKVVVYLISERQLNLAKLFDTGGMPSSHAASVVGLASGVGLFRGFSSVEFAVAFVLAAVVIYDATGIRKAAGEQAQTLNRIIPQLLRGKLLKDIDFKVFKELLGHNPLDVVIGFAFGVLSGLVVFVLYLLLWQQPAT
jgi:hypothetical protein